MRHPNTVAALFGCLFCLFAPSLSATTIIPYPHLGAMAAASDAVVLVTVEQRTEQVVDGVTYTRTVLKTDTPIKGALTRGTEIELLQAPRGNDWARAVSTDVEFEVGRSYLLFLDRRHDRWQPKLSAYGIFELQRVGKDTYAVPTPESLGFGVLPRPDGQAVEPLTVYRADALLHHLREVTAGRADWDLASVVAEEEVVETLLVAAKDAPAYCDYLGSPSAGFRWTNPLTQPIPVHYPQGWSGCGQLERIQQIVREIINRINTSYGGIRLTDGGYYTGPATTCLGGRSAGSDFTSWVDNNLGGRRHIVIQLEDPCNELGDVINCAGVYGWGGLYGYSPLYTINGESYFEGAFGYVILNDGTCGCLSDEDYIQMLMHEITHALGLDHITPSAGAANMNPSCCSPVTALDQACVNYMYEPAAAPLPVELVDFRAAPHEEGVLLNWRTASESGNQHFEVERSADGLSFTTIAMVPGAGHSSVMRAYDYMDLQPLTGLSYYRLKQVDYGGAYAYSPIVSIDVGAANAAIRLAQNPVTTDQLELWLPRDRQRQYVIDILDLDGRRLQRTQLDGLSGIVPLQALSAGVYVARITYDGKTETLKFVKL